MKITKCDGVLKIVFKEGPEIRVGGIGCRLGEDETPEKYRTWISGFYTGLDAK